MSCSDTQVDLLKPSRYSPQDYFTASDIVSHAVRSAFLSPEKWEANPNSCRYVFSKTNRLGSISVSLRPESEQPCGIYTNTGFDESAISEWMEPIFHIIRTFGDLHADVFDILVMRWLEEHKGDMNHWSEISAHDIISARGLKTANGSIRREDTVSYGRVLKDVLRPAVQGSVKCFLRGNARQTEKASFLEDPLFAIDSCIPMPGNTDGSAILGVKYRPGSWVRYILEPYTPQLAKISKHLLEFDPYHEKKEKRLMRYFETQLFRLNGGKPKTLSMSAILEGACISPTGAGRKDPSRFMQSVEDALHGVFSCYGGGEAKCLDTGGLPREGKLGIWMKRQWHIEPPQHVQDDYADVRSRKAKYREKAKKGRQAGR
ncbi:MAG: hypothetical protein ACYC4F_09565 [Armatimonadota bacterium]